MKPVKKIRKCPYCKSNKGFELVIRLGGFHTMHVSFGGKVLYNIREGTDDYPRGVECLNCKKSIDIEKVKFEDT